MMSALVTPSVKPKVRVQSFAALNNAGAYRKIVSGDGRLEVDVRDPLQEDLSPELECVRFFDKIRVTAENDPEVNETIWPANWSPLHLFVAPGFQIFTVDTLLALEYHDHQRSWKSARQHGFERIAFFIEGDKSRWYPFEDGDVIIDRENPDQPIRLKPNEVYTYDS